MIQLPEGVACLKCCSGKCECPERHETQWVPCLCEFCKANYKAVREYIVKATPTTEKRIPAAYLTHP
jgi:hypothetical protein